MSMDYIHFHNFIRCVNVTRSIWTLQQQLLRLFTSTVVSRTALKGAQLQ